MNTSAKVLLFFISVAGIGTAGYLLTRKSKKELREAILSKIPVKDWEDMIPKLNLMTRQELADVYQVVQYKENTPASVTAKIDSALRIRVFAISKKYNIFT